MGVLPYLQAKHDCVQGHGGSRTSSHFGLPKIRRMRANTVKETVGRVACSNEMTWGLNK